MNCKPGDLARIVNGGKLTNRLVFVLHMAPQGRFVLPDGYPTAEKKAPPGVNWVCESAGAPFEALLAGGGIRQTRFGVIHDNYLRPIRDPGEDAVDETLQRLPAPRRDEVMA